MQKILEMSQILKINSWRHHVHCCILILFKLIYTGKYANCKTKKNIRIFSDNFMCKNISPKLIFFYKAAIEKSIILQILDTRVLSTIKCRRYRFVKIFLFFFSVWMYHIWLYICEPFFKHSMFRIEIFFFES